jgi:putative ABC transport system permease protein
MPPWISALWRWSLWAYPVEFREEYGQPMTQDFAERYHEERGAARYRLCWLTLLDVLRTGAKERYFKMKKDLKHSFRRLAATPILATVLVLSLALGVGANSAIFSVVHAVLLRPLPYPDIERRTIIFTGPPDSIQRGLATTLDFIDWRARSQSLTDWHLFSFSAPTTVIGAGLTERIVGQHVTPGLLDSLGVKPVIGRLFRAGEEAERPALISEGYWRRRFGGTRDVIGRRIQVGDGVHTIIGVVPSGFALFDEPSATEFWNTINLSPGSIWLQRRSPWLMAVASLQPGASLRQAQAELSSIAAGLEATYPQTNKRRGVRLMSMTEARTGHLNATFYPLLGAVSLILLIACTNVANLLLARAASRRREISVRSALGAGRGRLMREFLADGVVVAVPAVLAGLALAWGGVRLFQGIAPVGYPGAATAEINLPVLAFTAVTGLAAGILAALFPAIQASKVDLVESLKEGGHGPAGRASLRLRSVLVAGEVALSLILLAGAGLLIASIFRLQHHPLGLETAGVTVGRFDLTGPRYARIAPQREMDMRLVEPPVGQFIEQMLQSVRALPGVESAALAGHVAMGPTFPGTPAQIRTASRADEDGNLPRASHNIITDGYFETLRIPLRQGRYLQEQDRASGLWVAMVNETFAREMFPDGKALGEEVAILPSGIAQAEERPRRIVGVIADHIQMVPGRPVMAEVYTSYAQQPGVIPGTMQSQRFRPHLVVRSRVPDSVSADRLGRIAAAIDPQLGIFDVRTLEGHMAARQGPLRFYAQALALFSLIAIGLAAVGIYGLMNFSVADRMHEISIRMSLGATRRRVVWLIVAHGLRLAGGGIVLGIAGALATTSVLRQYLFEIQPWDPATYSIAAAGVCVIALVSCAVPAWRASRIDPLVALRRE